jgi:hypothetical protein
MKFRDISNVGPAGAINSTANEMSHWVALQLGQGEWHGKRLAQSATLDELHTVRMPMGPPSPLTPEVVPVGYALGWMVDVYRGHLRVQHGGNIDGFSALVALLPQDDLGFVVLTNLNATPLADLAVKHASDRLLGLERTDWNARSLARREQAKAETDEAEKNKAVVKKSGTSPSHPLAAYAGEYEHPAYGVIRVALEGDALRADFHGLPAPLEHWHYDVFNVKRDDVDPVLADTKLQFGTGFDGEIDGLRVVMEPSLDPIVFARRADASMNDPKVLARYAGDFVVNGSVASFAVQGTSLTLFVPGRPLYTLAPKDKDKFAIRGLTGFNVQFVADDAGKYSSVRFDQPNGVFTAKRK